MATFTITTAVNIDSLASKAGSDTYNINGGYLTVDQDTRYGVNGAAVAAMGNLTLSATLGGTVEFTSELVRIIPYNTGTGNVPAYGTTISQGSASGKMIAVMSTIGTAPTAPGAAMPASGFIKIKQWNSVAFTSGALTGIGASATGADSEGWIEIVGVDSLLFTLNRLGTFKVRGTWFNVGTTNGTRATTYQLPSQGQVFYASGVWVETAAGSDSYEFYPCAGSLAATAANIATDETRGRFCWISTAGLLRFGHDGTNSTGGFIPESGRKIRIPSIFFMTCAAAGTVNTIPNSTIGTRMEFATTGGGVMDIDKANINWYMNLNQPYSLTFSNVGIMSALITTEIAQPVTWSQVGIGQEAAATRFAWDASLCFAGGTLTDCVFTRATLATSGHYVATLTDMSGFTFTRCRWHGMVARGNTTTGCITLIRVASSTFDTCTFGDGRVLMTTCTDLNFDDSKYYDTPAGQTSSSLAMYLYDLSTNCNRIKMDGVTFPVAYTQPYNGILNIGTAGCSAIKLRNLGTYESPLDLGGARRDDQAWTRVTTTATVTSTDHGLATGMSVYVVVSSAEAAIVVGLKTITVTGANTFTFTCLNAGSTSGTICFFPTVCANLFVLATSAAANDVKIQRCFTPHTRTNLFTADNSSKNILLETIFSDYLNVPLFALLNGYIKGVSGSPSLAVQTSVYGTHFVDVWSYDNPDSKTGVSWSRTTTTATVTVPGGHNLRTACAIVVTVCSDETPIPLGIKSTITCTSSTTFTFTCTNSGGTSGTLSFEPLISRVAVLMNEATAETSSFYTIDNGSSPSIGFSSAGTLVANTINDQITWTQPNYMLGVTGFPPAEPVMGGGTITNYDLTYAIDKNDGSGFSSFKNLSYSRAGGGGTNGSNNITMTSTTGVNIDDYIYGTNVRGLARVHSISDGTTIVSTGQNIGTVSGILRFGALPNETGINPVSGIKLNVRLKTTTSSSTGIQSISIFTKSTRNERAAEYPLDTADVSITAKNAADSSTIQNAKILLEADTGGVLPSYSNTSSNVISLTVSSNTATVVHYSEHNLTTGNQVIVRGANQYQYNKIATITVANTTAYTFSVNGAPASPGTGTIKAAALILSGNTNSSGVVTGTVEYTGTDQPVKGTARKGTSAPYFKPALLSGTITSTGFETTVFMVSDT